MFFDLNLFGIHKKASFSQCWLAATNPQLFKNFVLHGEMDEIGIPTLCDEMRVELNAGLMNSNQRVPLYFAAQLVYGAVRIYQQQVQTLYEKTNHLICFHNATMQEIMRKRRRTSEESHQGKKQKLPLDLAEDAKKYEIDLPDTKSEDVCELLGHDTQAGNPQDLLIHEEIKDDIIIKDEDEDFGVINEVEMLHLLDSLRSDDDESSEDIQNCFKNEKKKMQDRSKSNLNENIPAQNRDNDVHREVDLIREAIREEEAMPLISMQDIIDQNNSIQIDESSIENMMSFGLQLPLIENMDTGGEPNAVIVPDQPGHLDDLTLAELIVPKRKRKISKLKVDTCIKISYNDFIKQFDYSKTLRCFTPRMDVVHPYEMVLKPSNTLFKMSASNLGSKKLVKAFNRHLKTKVTEVDPKILDDILGMESADFEEVNPVIGGKSLRLAACRQNVLNRRSQVGEPLASVLPPFEVTNALEMTTNALETAGLPDIIPMNAQLSDPKNSVDDPLYLRLKEDLLKDFQGETDEQEDSNLCNSTELNRSQWGKILLIRRLLHLWKNKVETITMDLLCHGVQRKNAAYAFLCLLELKARQYVEIKRNTETNEINNIEMGIKLLNRLNGTFK